MTTYTLTLLSPIVGDGTPEINPYRPKFSDDHPELSYSDMTGQNLENQPGDPPLVMLAVTTNDPDPLYADPDVFILEDVENVEEPN